MSSLALVAWRTDRAARIQELLDAHQRVGGTGNGRRWRTTQLNWALTLRVAGEFQGYARSLHDLAVDEMATQVAQMNFPVSTTLRRIMTSERRLDRGNPGPDALARDFGQLGMELWTELKRKYPAKAVKAQDQLQALLDARNGIAHSDHRKIATVEARGYPLTRLSTVRSWHSWMNQLCGKMDATVSVYIARVFGGAPPW